MDVRIPVSNFRIIFALAAFLSLSAVAPKANAQRLFQAHSENFVVHAYNSQLAQTIAVRAEEYRKKLSLEWLGYEIGPWKERCPIQVELAPHAGGETSFAFIMPEGQTKGIPVSWQMRIFGPADRLLDAVLPHEVTHTIFATHFGRPLPRWADEGACTTVEHASEREKNHQMLMDFLTAKPTRGIPFNRMFVMREYPRDILPLYAQGYSLARFLIGQRGKRHFINYVEAGMNAERPGRELAGWNDTTQEYFGYKDLSELQIDWLTWVKNGCRELQPAPKTLAVAKLNPSDSTPKQPVGSWYFREAKIDRRPPKERVAANRTVIPVSQPPADNDKDQPQTEAVLNSRLNTGTIWR